jgi:hyaluronate lyase
MPGGQRAGSRRKGRTAKAHVFEPARTGEEFEVTWHRPVRKVLSADEGVEVLEATKSLRLRVTSGTSKATLGCKVLLR